MTREEQKKWVIGWLEESGLELGHHDNYSCRAIFHKEYAEIEYSDDNGWHLYQSEDAPEIEFKYTEYTK